MQISSECWCPSAYIKHFQFVYIRLSSTLQIWRIFRSCTGEYRTRFSMYLLQV